MYYENMKLRGDMEALKKCREEDRKELDDLKEEMKKMKRWLKSLTKGKLYSCYTKLAAVTNQISVHAVVP